MILSTKHLFDIMSFLFIYVENVKKYKIKIISKVNLHIRLKLFLEDNIFRLLHVNLKSKHTS